MEADQAALSAMPKLARENGVEAGKPITDPNVFGLIAAQMESIQDLQSKHRARIKAILEKHGWPGRSLVGTNGAHAAWLIVQHADADPALQEKCLKLMTAVPAGEVESRDIAYLTDRILVAQKKRQRYGTQLGADFQPLPIEDLQGVDARRKAMGLPTLAEYLESAWAEYERQFKPLKKK
jgi:hypothetical protein